MTTSGTGVYFDGQTSRRQDVHVELGPELVLLQPDGRRLLGWPLTALRELSSPPGVLRVTREGGPPLARLDIRDPGLADAVRAAAPNLGASRVTESGVVRRVVLWSVAAVVSFGAFALYGVPVLADRITPLLPWSVDRRMGDAVDRQIRYILPTTDDGPFACGDAENEKAGRAALDTLAKRLSDAAALPVPINIVAVRSDIPNAFALPGGHVYLFDGLIREAETPDEIAGVLAHEIGHVAHRDGTRRTLQAGGVSFLFGFVLGDFTGGGAAVFVARLLTEASYSRAAESAADSYAVTLMRGLGADAKGFGGLLARLSAEDAKDKSSPFDYLASHPATGERRRAIDAAAGDGATRPLLDDAAFKALKTVCGPEAPKPVDGASKDGAKDEAKTP